MGDFTPLLPVVGFTYRDDYSREILVESVTPTRVCIRTTNWRKQTWRGRWSYATWRRRISHLVSTNIDG